MADSPVVRGARVTDPPLEELRERVSSRFRSVGLAAGELRVELRAATDLRKLAGRHPAWVLGAAAGAGLLAAGLVRRGRRESGGKRAWLAGVSDGRRPPRALAVVGAPAVRGALGILAGVLVRRFARRVGEELRSRTRIAGSPSGTGVMIVETACTLEPHGDAAFRPSRGRPAP